MTQTSEQRQLAADVAKCQYQLDHADELEIPDVGRRAYQDFIDRYTPTPEPTDDDMLWLTCLSCGSSIRHDEARPNGLCTCCTMESTPTYTKDELWSIRNG